MDKKNTEYQPNLMNEDDADKAIKWAERILDKVKGKLKL
jgi:HEPN domain-containing protein